MRARRISSAPQMMNGNGATVASCPPDKAAVPKNPCIAGRADGDAEHRSAVRAIA